MGGASLWIPPLTLQVLSLSSSQATSVPRLGQGYSPLPLTKPIPQLLTKPLTSPSPLPSPTTLKHIFFTAPLRGRGCSFRNHHARPTLSPELSRTRTTTSKFGPFLNSTSCLAQGRPPLESNSVSRSVQSHTPSIDSGPNPRPAHSGASPTACFKPHPF